MPDSDLLRAALRRDFSSVAPSSDRAWSRAPAVRVIDCVLSLCRNYDRFVVPRLDAFERQFPHVAAIHDLRDLMDSAGSPAAFVKNSLNYNDPQRALTLSGVVDYLLDTALSAKSGTELERLRRWADNVRPPAHRELGIRGFGLAGLQYLRMLFGANTTKPDIHIRRYVETSIGRQVSDIEALGLLEEAARVESMSLRDLDTSIWEHSARSVSRCEGM
jgi:hypothetical protein